MGPMVSTTALRRRQYEWSCLAVVALICLLRFPIHFLVGNPFLMDYAVYRSTAELVASGQGLQLYDFA